MKKKIFMLIGLSLTLFLICGGLIWSGGKKEVPEGPTGSVRFLIAENFWAD